MDNKLIYVLCIVGMVVSFFFLILLLAVPFNYNLKTKERVFYFFVCLCLLGIFVTCLYFLIDILKKEKQKKK